MVFSSSTITHVGVLLAVVSITIMTMASMTPTPLRGNCWYNVRGLKFSVRVRGLRDLVVDGLGDCRYGFPGLSMCLEVSLLYVSLNLTS